MYNSKTFMFGLVFVSAGIIFAALWLWRGGVQDGRPAVSQSVPLKLLTTSTDHFSNNSMTDFGTLVPPSDWNIVNVALAGPIRVATPSGWKVAIESAVGTQALPYVSATNNESGSYVNITDDPTKPYDHSVQDLLRDTDLRQVSRTTIGGLAAIQGYSIYPYDQINYAEKEFQVFSPSGTLYEISYHCPAPSERSICDQIVSYIQFK